MAMTAAIVMRSITNGSQMKALTRVSLPASATLGPNTIVASALRGFYVVDDSDLVAWASTVEKKERGKLMILCAYLAKSL